MTEVLQLVLASYFILQTTGLVFTAPLFIPFSYTGPYLKFYWVCKVHYI